jgi:hypothetical protein
MKLSDAMNLLNLSGTVTQKDIKKAYKSASIKFHPDRNPAGAEMMKAINAAYDALLKAGDSVTMDADANVYDFGEQLNNVLNELLKMTGLDIEVCGNWIWISGDTKPNRDAIKALGCMWAKKKKMWYFRPSDYKSFGRGSFSIDEIREKHGSTKFKASGRKSLNAA